MLFGLNTNKFKDNFILKGEDLFFWSLDKCGIEIVEIKA